jgi:hypothetical protein
MTPLERARAIARVAAFLAPACAASAIGCVTTHILADADKSRLESSAALAGQMYKDLAPDSGVPALVLRAEAAGIFCSDTNVLVGSGVPAPDGGLKCPKVNQ